MKMKFSNLKYMAVAIALSMTASSCGDFLDRPTEDSYNEDNYYDTDDQCISVGQLRQFCCGRYTVLIPILDHDKQYADHYQHYSYHYDLDRNATASDLFLEGFSHRIIK